jgi:FtsH-binding integral membrane protein
MSTSFANPAPWSTSSSAPQKDLFHHLTNFTLPISPKARRHLTHVYATLFLTVAFTALGSLLHLRYHAGGLFTHFASMGLLVAIAATASSPGSSPSAWVKGVPNALWLLCAYGVCQGLSIGPLIETAVYVDPSLLVTAFVLTANIFLCFSLTSLYIPRRSHLALAGVLSTSISFLLCLSLLSLFFPTVWAFKVQLWLGLLVFCGYIIVDTQAIIDNAETSSNPNFITDALKMFTNLLAVFVRLVIILLQNAAKGKEEDNNRRRNNRR